MRLRHVAGKIGRAVFHGPSVTFRLSPGFPGFPGFFGLATRLKKSPGWDSERKHSMSSAGTMRNAVAPCCRARRFGVLSGAGSQSIAPQLAVGVEVLRRP